LYDGSSNVVFSRAQDSMPPLQIPLGRTDSEDFSVNGRNKFGSSEQWTVGYDDNQGLSQFFGTTSW
jgi:hypothetical protein